MSLSIIIPAYNETNQIDHTVKKLNNLKIKINNYDIIFIDDFCEDNSSLKLKKFEKNHNRIRVFKNKKKGLGQAVELGIIKSKKENVCLFMCDLSDDVNDIIRYYKCIKNNPELDAVFGTRFSKNSNVTNYPFLKLIINRVANNFIRVLFLSNYNDFTNAFKMYKKKRS